MRTVIKVEHLSKQFRIGKLRRDEGTLRDVVGNFIKRPFEKGEKDRQFETLQALKDVSFEVNKGDTFGIVGGNGAGKSTLLKILSRIIKPSSGRARLEGRVGSLLEIGTGFHQDLTGRENVFLNGAVLGMRRREVAAKFDEIVAFADLEKFLDTPVKFYSSGMYARLAFAVAAHLEPEILIIDEVLAVGDAAFQAKCLGKMGSIAEDGRTVLFVSHSAAMVENLCKNGLYLEKGAVKAIGRMKDVMSYYRADYEIPETAPKIPRTSEAVSREESLFIEWKLLNSVDLHKLVTGEQAVFEFTFVHHRRATSIKIRFLISDLEGRIILADENIGWVEDGVNRLQWICRLPLKPNIYQITAEAFSIEESSLFDSWQCESCLEILPGDGSASSEQGIIDIPTKFEVVDSKRSS